MFTPPTHNALCGCTAVCTLTYFCKGIRINTPTHNALGGCTRCVYIDLFL